MNKYIYLIPLFLTLNTPFLLKCTKQSDSEGLPSVKSSEKIKKDKHKCSELVLSEDCYEYLRQLALELYTYGTLHHIIQKYRQPDYEMPEGLEYCFQNLFDKQRPQYPGIRQAILFQYDKILSAKINRPSDCILF